MEVAVYETSCQCSNCNKEAKRLYVIHNLVLCRDCFIELHNCVTMKLMEEINK